jgi:hypothetical protein
MNRRAYRAARRLLRDNGRAALRWLVEDERQVMDALLTIQAGTDRLAERASIIAYWGSKPEPPKIPSADQRGLSRARSMG